MNKTLVITVLVENSVHRRDLMAEHGLAFHLQAGSTSMLFDTGQSELVLANAKRLGVDLTKLQAVALSHGHYDHTGGLAAVWRLAPEAILYAHSEALGPHFTRDPEGSMRAIGMDRKTREVCLGRVRMLGDAPSEVLEGVFLSGSIPRITGFEDVGGAFYLDEAAQRLDPIQDDQSLYFDTPDGLVVVLGCAHAGVVNTLRHIQDLTRGRPIHTVLGGMHLLNARSERIEKTVEALREIGVQHIGPAHCTGMTATARLWREFPEACKTCAVGSQFAFER